MDYYFYSRIQKTYDYIGIEFAKNIAKSELKHQRDFRIKSLATEI